VKVIAEVVGEQESGIRIIRFFEEELLEKLGQIPLPPYIRVPLGAPERYQTVYARVAGSVAAPTAGLHFTPQLLKVIEEKGTQFALVTLHVGLDSFRPIQVEDPCQHPIHSEYGELSPEAANLLNRARVGGGRIICVGTTTVRLVEAVARASGGMRLQPFKGWVDLFILPGYQFQVVDAMLTNFHLPRSTLLMLVSAFAGKELVDHAYEEAIRLRYRFYSFGDAMLIF
jgi:S-adenosylmethionine:tRNA ribosyltransferase-isomerase